MIIKISYKWSENIVNSVLRSKDKRLKLRPKFNETIQDLKFSLT